MEQRHVLFDAGGRILFRLLVLRLDPKRVECRLVAEAVDSNRLAGGFRGIVLRRLAVLRPEQRLADAPQPGKQQIAAGIVHGSSCLCQPKLFFHVLGKRFPPVLDRIIAGLAGVWCRPKTVQALAQQNFSGSGWVEESVY